MHDPKCDQKREKDDRKSDDPSDISCGHSSAGAYRSAQGRFAGPVLDVENLSILIINQWQIGPAAAADLIIGDITRPASKTFDIGILSMPAGRGFGHDFYFRPDSLVRINPAFLASSIIFFWVNIA